MKGRQGRGRARQCGFRRQTAHLPAANVVLYGLCEAICQYECGSPRKISKWIVWRICKYGAGKPKVLLSAPLDHLEERLDAILQELVVVLPEKPRREKP